jgi:hypothetical protein
LNWLKTIFKSNRGFYAHTLPHPLTNGAEHVGFVQKFQNPAQSVLGVGFRAGSVNVTQGPQIYHFLKVPTSGLGGIQAGQIFGSPLTDSNYNQVE